MHGLPSRPSPGPQALLYWRVRVAASESIFIERKSTMAMLPKPAHTTRGPREPVGRRTDKMQQPHTRGRSPFLYKSEDRCPPSRRLS